MRFANQGWSEPEGMGTMKGRFLLALSALFSASAIAGEPAADRVTLRDGSVVLGLATSANAGSRGSVEIVVRRDWARTALPKQAPLWEKTVARTSRQALDQRRKRLETWKRERTAGAANRKPPAGAKGEDRILSWLDGELKRLADPASVSGSPLMSIKLPRSEVRGLERKPAAVERMFRLAWISNLPNPESMTAGELKNALESRGFATDLAAKSPPASLDKLLPPSVETDAAWLARRAATEVTVDPGLRFVRYQNLLFPDAPLDQAAAGGLGISTALDELKRLLDPNAQPAVDPLVKEFRAIESAGGAGAVVTRLALLPDLGGAAVEVTLWVRQAHEHWIPAGSRTATVRSGEVQAGAAGAIAADPQVQGAFQIIE